MSNIMVTWGTGGEGFHVNVGTTGTPVWQGGGGIDIFEVMLYGIQLRNALRRLKKKGMTGEMELLLVADAVGNVNLHAEIPLTTLSEDWGEAVEMGLVIYVGAKRLKAQGMSGVIRTQLQARSVDNPDLVITVPFITITP